MAQIDSIQRVELFPSNRPSTTNTYSYREGNPTLVFSFSENDSQYLLSNTLRLNFGLQLKTSANVDPNNDDQLGTGTGNQVKQNAIVGAMSCIESITISNNLNQQLEYVRNYPRLLSSMLSMVSNFRDFATILDCQFSSTSNDAANGLKQNNAQEVSAPILAGMFLNGSAIPMGGSGRGTMGLTIKIQLAPSIKANFGAVAGGVGSASGSYYEIVNPTITAAMGVVNGGLPKIKMMPYNSFSSYYAVLNNSDETLNIPTGLSSVLAQFSNFIPTTVIANATLDGNQTPPLRNLVGGSAVDPSGYAPITRYTTMRGNLQYPYRFAVNEERNVVTDAATGLYTANYTAQRQRNFLSALKPIDRLTGTLAGNLSEATIASNGSTNYNQPGSNVTGVGCRYDLLNAGQGADFSKASFSHRFQSRLDGVSPNSVYTFMLHKNMISYTPQGISVAS